MALSRLATITRQFAPTAAASSSMMPAAQQRVQSVVATRCVAIRPRCCSASFSVQARRSTANGPLLPPQSAQDQGRLTVVLDMDETLLHSELLPLSAKDAAALLAADPRSAHDHHDKEAAALEAAGKKRPEIEFVIGANTASRERVRTSLRPGLREFLQALSERFEPVLFTSAMPIYASPLLDRIEGKTEATLKQFGGDAPIPPAFPEAPFAAENLPVFRHRLYRDSTVPAHEIDYDYVKDISTSRLGRDMRRVVLIDNSWHACIHNPDNSIVVPDYLGAKADPLFAALLAMLDHLRTQEDVRPFLIQKIKLREQLSKQGFKFPGSPPLDLSAPAEKKSSSAVCIPGRRKPRNSPLSDERHDA